MKSKFIEGTEGKYSARYNGDIVMNYMYNTHGVFKKLRPARKINVSSYGTICINQKTYRYRQVLKNTLGIFFCIHCNKRFEYKNGFVCKRCLQSQRNARTREWSKSHPEYVKSVNKNQVDKLTRTYIVHSILNMKSSDNIPEEIIIAARNQIKLHRELKKQKQNDTN